MTLRLIKWLIVVLIAAAIVVALDRILRADARAALPTPSAPAIHQNAEMPAMPTAPDCQAASRCRSSIPPSA